MKKDFIFLAIIIFLAVVLFQGVKIQSVEEYYDEHLDDIVDGAETVYISIDCITALDYANMLAPAQNQKMPSDGIIFATKQLRLRKNDTVYDILNRVTRVYKIQAESIYAKQFGSVYIQGINHLYEFDCGDLSGWMYSVNGVFPNYGCSKYYLKEGDVICWRYTCDLGRDIGGDMLDTPNNNGSEQNNAEPQSDYGEQNNFNKQNICIKQGGYIKQSDYVKWNKKHIGRAKQSGNTNVATATLKSKNKHCFKREGCYEIL